jgi:hypothetical protein
MPLLEKSRNPKGLIVSSSVSPISGLGQEVIDTAAIGMSKVAAKQHAA